MRDWIFRLAVIAVLGAGAFWLLTEPERLSAAVLTVSSGDAARGETVFHASGCASCHSAPKAKDEAKRVLEGGQRFATPFGTFVAPNISPDPEAGIGGWSFVDFATAMRKGVSPDGRHYYPAFPYASYARATDQDLADLWAFMQTLPRASRANEPHEVGFPFSIRRGLGLWKMVALPSPDEPIATLEGRGADLERGRYLVEGLGHCGECHTPRNAIGALDTERWLGGAPTMDGSGRVPNITPGAKDIGSWSAADIAEYLKSGFTPDFDTAGAEMVAVIENTAQLTDDDRAAIAAYLKAVPPVRPAE